VLTVWMTTPRTRRQRGFYVDIHNSIVTPQQYVEMMVDTLWGLNVN